MNIASNKLAGIGEPTLAGKKRRQVGGRTAGTDELKGIANCKPSEHLADPSPRAQRAFRQVLRGALPSCLSERNITTCGGCLLPWLTHMMRGLYSRGSIKS